MAVNSNNGAGKGLARPTRPARILQAVSDGSILFIVLVFSALAIVALAIGAPIALAVSALAGLVFPSRTRHGWRDVGAA